ncbi:uncharacterized protein BT62DRAFT_117731 [Guyanagaster necrorhizus]|uniref:DUF1279 domain-containing protein n=1 Tax=Guyanagaster necrorhizus TaxID=856835 RepID=A0A9P7VTP1_9AGAR|nr:uncharacterized protein BT62DRAFT_117731 [Guyanagaster necrorhizus MCA 3950]KAG7446423.1 hypothetical protein BT62DRAFT_117731 [Guyanagaster necrorhizus MCA 3950]
MSRRIFRLPFLRSVVPRLSAPLLPVLRPGVLQNSPRISHSRLFSHFPARLSSSPRPLSDLPPNATLSERLKYLIKSYGWYAFGVYLVLSAVDFGISFAAINLIGAQQVSQLAASAKEAVVSLVYSRPPDPGQEDMDSAVRGIEQGGNEGLYAMIVLAYTIHKTVFFPVRIGLTAGLTPKLVGWLRQRGWTGGAGTRRAATEMRDKLRRNSRS